MNEKFDPSIHTIPETIYFNVDQTLFQCIIWTIENKFSLINLTNPSLDIDKSNSLIQIAASNQNTYFTLKKIISNRDLLKHFLQKYIQNRDLVLNNMINSPKLNELTQDNLYTLLKQFHPLYFDLFLNDFINAKDKLYRFNINELLPKTLPLKHIIINNIPYSKEAANLQLKKIRNNLINQYENTRNLIPSPTYLYRTVTKIELQQILQDGYFMNYNTQYSIPTAFQLEEYLFRNDSFLSIFHRESNYAKILIRVKSNGLFGIKFSGGQQIVETLVTQPIDVELSQDFGKTFLSVEQYKLQS